MKQITALETVATLSEVCDAWQLDRKTLIWQYWNGYLEMRKSGRIWLVDLASMRQEVLRKKDIKRREAMKDEKRNSA